MLASYYLSRPGKREAPTEPGILVRGAELTELHTEIWPLLAFFAVFLALATLRFTKRPD